MDVAGPQADPVHRGQMADRVRGVRVLDQLGPRGRAGGEVQQQRVVGPGGAVRRRTPAVAGVRRRRRSASPSDRLARRRSGCSRPARRRTCRCWPSRRSTCRAPPRSTRSRRSAGPSSGVAGMTTAPSFIAASIVSHSSTWLPSMRMIRSPRPHALRRAASSRPGWTARTARRTTSFCSAPSSSTIHSAGRSLPVGDRVEPVERPVERAELGPAELARRPSS